MYHMSGYNLEQNNIAIKLLGKLGIDSRIHWLNPLFIKCRNK